MSFHQELQINQTADAKRPPLPCLNSNNYIDTENPTFIPVSMPIHLTYYNTKTQR